MKNTGFGYMHYTLSAWKSEEDLKRFAHSGAHKEAMKQTKQLATEIKIYTYQGSEFPSWEEAKQLLNEKGKKLTFE